MLTLRKFCRIACLSATLVALPVGAQPSGLPSMGSAGGTELSPALERTLGNAIMEQGRRDPTYIAEPAVEQYLTRMGHRLAKHAPQSLSQTIQVFALRDPSINAFALPGGYVGIHSGLVVNAETEAELASVVAHEIGHVAQRHIARGMTQRSESGHILFASIAGALLAALSGSADLAMGVAAFGQAAAVDRQLGFSRSAEHEADRTGLQMLQRAGYDPKGMVDMFRRLMTASRLNEGTGSANVYTSTHPLSIQRMSDIENRLRQDGAQNYYTDPDFWYVRAKLRVIQATSRQARLSVMDRLRADTQEQRGTAQAAAWYGLAYAEFENKNYAGAQEAWQHAQRLGGQTTWTDALSIRLHQAQGQGSQALTLAQAAVKRWPQSLDIALTYGELLQQQGHNAQAIDYLKQAAQSWPDVPRIQQLLAQSYERTNQAALARRSMANYYTLVGALPAAVEQLQQARNQSKDFYEQSQLDVQIRELRERVETERLLLERFKS